MIASSSMSSLQYAHLVGLGANLYDKGYSNLTNIDTSSVVISQMSNLYADRQDMECEHAVLKRW